MSTEHKHRLITAIEAKGGVGKTTETLARIPWYDSLGVKWQGFDLDGDNQTFYRSYKEMVQLVPFDGPETYPDIVKILQRVEKSDADVTVMDVRAHADTGILSVFDHTKFLERAADHGVRITALVFPVEELDVLANLAHVIEKLGEKVDWLVVKNLGRTPRFDLWDGCSVRTQLQAMDAIEIEMPVLLSNARNALAQADSKHDRGLRLDGLESMGFDDIVLGLIDDWRERMAEKYARAGRYLVPTTLMDRLPKGKAEHRKGSTSTRAKLLTVAE